jgi:hypothetical protein
MAKKKQPTSAAGGAPAGRTRTHRGSHAPKRRPSVLPWLIGIGVVALFAVPIVISTVQRANLPGRHVASLGNAHISDTAPTPRYNSNPPTSGPHFARVAAGGSYVDELPDPLLVHNMEDGYVVLWYRPGDEEHNAQRVRQYEEAASGYRRVVIVPRSEMEHEYALTAWQRIDTFDAFDAERVRAFVRAFEGKDHHRR